MIPNLIATAVAEDVELFLKRVHAQGVFHQHGQAIDAAAEVDHISTQVDRRDVIGGPHHDSVAAVVKTRDKVAVSTAPLNETARPLGSWICH